MKALFEKFLKLFEVDVTEDGESNKLVRVIRALEFVTFVYGMADLIFSLFRGLYASAVCFAVVVVVALVFIHMSYHSKTITQILLVNITTLVAVSVCFCMSGGNTRVHTFLIVLVILAFFSQYGYYKLKTIYTVVIATLYIVFEITKEKLTPVVGTDNIENIFFSIADIVAIFVCISIICYVYSRDSQHLEGKLIEYNNLLKKQASTDPLTGLCNRRSAIEMINRLIKEAKEPGFCVCMCDIDFFKKINDSYGHDIGDNVLRGIASTMLEGFPQKCLISRWGGEEFLVVFPEMNGDDAKMILDVMRAKLKKMEYRAGEKRFGVTLTFGLAEYGFDGNSEALVKEADKKLYYGKEHGRDQVVF